jgi:hypothetical protein
VGHQLGQLPPNTRSWRAVVEAVADGGDVAAVAAATLAAAKRGIQKAYDDPGLVQAVYLLARTVLAARTPDFVGEPAALGVHVPPAFDVLDLAAGFSDAIDAHLRKKGGRTDLGEMADLAAVRALTRTLGDRCADLFGASAAGVQEAARASSTRIGFGALYHEFFAEFTRHFLTYHLGRELSFHVGETKRFADSAEHSEFLDELRGYCAERARIVKTFAGDWYDKHRDRITPARAKGFVNYCLTKLLQELDLRGAGHGD